jgi:hypothetical protein
MEKPHVKTTAVEARRNGHRKILGQTVQVSLSIPEQVPCPSRARTDGILGMVHLLDMCGCINSKHVRKTTCSSIIIHSFNDSFQGFDSGIYTIIIAEKAL